MKDSPKKLKILYLITKSNFGGAQRYVYDLAVEGAKLGHDVLVGFGGSGVLATKLEARGVRTVSIPELERDINLLADCKSFVALFRVIKKESPNVVHCNSSKMGGLGALAARTYNLLAHTKRLMGKNVHTVRIIFTGHGWAFNEERNDFQRFLIGCAHWATIAFAHRTIAVSRKTREQVGKLPFVLHKIVIIHNGVGTPTTLSKEKALETIFGTHKTLWLKEKPFIVGTIAELHKNKGLSYAIEGIAQLKKQVDVSLLFIIIGAGEEHASLEALVQKLELTDVVFFAGQKENASTLLSAFDIFLLPSITEAFPYVILEAGNAGLPVIATSVGGIPEVIDDMESGILIQSKNSGEVTRALAYLIENPERREAIGEALATRIHGRFNLETMVEKTFELYEEN